MSERLTPQREAADEAVASLVNGGYAPQIAKEIVSRVRAEAAEEARTAAAAELAAVRAERDEMQSQLAEYEPLNSQQCPAGKHADWLIDSEFAHTCPWCQIEDLKEAAAFTERCTLPELRRSVDHHEGGKERWRKRAREAEAMVRELKRPAELACRAETRSSFTALMAEAEQAKDHEGAASLAQELAKVEAKWQREDEEATS